MLMLGFPNTTSGISQCYWWDFPTWHRDFPVLSVGFSNSALGFSNSTLGFSNVFGGIFQFSFGIFQFDIGIFQYFWWDFPNLHWNLPNMGYPIELGIPQVTWNIPCCNGISHVARILRRPTFSLGFPKIILAVYMKINPWNYTQAVYDFK